MCSQKCHPLFFPFQLHTHTHNPPKKDNLLSPRPFFICELSLPREKIQTTSLATLSPLLPKILYAKIMNALTRKARSRSKRHLSTTPPISYSHNEDSSSPSQPFVNYGLQKWNQDRLAWTSYKSPASTPKRIHSPTHPSPQQLEYDRDLLFHALTTPDNQGLLPKRVPLGELIAVLQDVRERGE